MMIVLIHGAWHDASCWRDVATELRRHGVQVLAVDLPIEDPSHGAEAFARTIVDAIDATGIDERIVVVGHSLGGLVGPVVAQQLGTERVQAIVLVAPMIPEPGLAHREAVRRDPGIYVLGPGQIRVAPRVTCWDEAAARDVLYAGVVEECIERRGLTRSAAEGRIRAEVSHLRPQAWTIDLEVTPLRGWPEVPTTVIVCGADRVLSPDRIRDRASRLIPGRVVDIPGGHFPLITMPRRLVEVILSASSDGRDSP